MPFARHVIDHFDGLGMPNIRLPDGSVRQFEQAVTVADVAANIGTGLAKAALAGKVTHPGQEAKLVDTSYLIEQDVDLAIITDKNDEGLEVIRHSTAHLLAYAVKELFPDAQVTIGPVIENGFYYDFSYKRPFTPDDLIAIEKKMAELAKKSNAKSCRVMRPWLISKALTNITKPKLLPVFLVMKMCLCTLKETSLTCAVAPTCPIPVS